MTLFFVILNKEKITLFLFFSFFLPLSFFLLFFHPLTKMSGPPKKKTDAKAKEHEDAIRLIERDNLPKLPVMGKDFPLTAEIPVHQVNKTKTFVAEQQPTTPMN